MSRQRRKSWVKLWVTGWLHGSIRWQMTSEERGVWADLMAIAGECGQDGAIIDRDGRPFPREFIANQLNIKQTLLDRVIAKCKHEGRIEDNAGEGIKLANWSHYQSEYDRQKPYQEKYRQFKKGHIDMGKLYDAVQGASSVHELNQIAHRVHDVREEMGDFKDDPDFPDPPILQE